MKSKIVYLLKHNWICQKLYIVVMSNLIRLLGMFVKTDENTILFLSFMGKSYSDSPKAIYEYLRRDLRYKDFCMIWAFENPKEFAGQLATVKIDTFAYFKTALKAKYWVTNTNIERGLHFKKKQTIYLNTWHGIALKHIGNDCPGRKDYNFDTVDYLVVSGRYDERVFRSAFNAQQKSYLRCGMPRNDRLWKADMTEKERMRKILNIPQDKKVILYAPTWRESTNGGKSYEIKPPIDFGLWQEELGEEYVIIFRAHVLTTKVLDVQFNSFMRDVTTYPDVNDLMIAADVLITDYSAIAFDYSILGRPILCFAYDYDSYLAERGTYFDISERYPMPLVRTEAELLVQIKNLNYASSCKATEEFRKKFIEYGGTATRQCVEALFGENG